MNESPEVEAYIEAFSEPVQSQLRRLRAIIREAAPLAVGPT